MVCICSCSSKKNITYTSSVPCCDGVDLSALLNKEIFNCGTIYSGNGFNKAYLKKVNQNRIRIANCVEKKAKNHISSLIEFEYAFMPDFEEKHFIIIEPNGKAVILKITYDGIDKWYWNHTVEICEEIQLKYNASYKVKSCKADVNLTSKLAAIKK